MTTLRPWALALVAVPILLVMVSLLKTAHGTISPCGMREATTSTQNKFVVICKRKPKRLRAIW